MATLTVTVKQKSSKGVSSLEGSFQLPASTTTKLSRKDGKTNFTNRAALNVAAKKVATALGWELSYEEPAKKAAKKSVKSKTAKAAKPKAKKAAPVATATTVAQ
jgi:hypothetical protein